MISEPLLVFLVLMLIAWCIKDVFLLMFLTLFDANIVLNLSDYFTVPVGINTWVLTIYIGLTLYTAWKCAHYANRTGMKLNYFKDD